MPTISAQTVQQILEPNLKKASGANVQVSYSNRSPGYLDKWASLLEGKENCWQQRQVTPTNISTRKKLILSDDILREVHPSIEIQQLISALFENYEVYLWQGDQISFSQLKPLQNSTEFWEKRETTTIASAQRVKQSLTSQGIPIDNCLFLDFVCGSDLLKKLGFSNNLGTNSNRKIRETHFVDFTENRLGDVDAKKITGINIDKPTTEQWDKIKTYSNLKKVQTSGSTKDFIDNDLSRFKGNELTLNLDYVNLNYIEFYEQDFEEISISDLRGRLNKLSQILFKQNTTRSQTKTSSLKKLILNCPNLLMLDINACHGLTELSLKNSTDLPYDPAYITDNLKNLSIENCGFSQLFAIKNNAIDLLAISDCEQLKKINLTFFTHLKKLSLTSCDNLNELIVSEQNSIEELEINYCNQFNCQFNHFKNLKRLSISGQSLITHLDLSELGELEELTIENCNALQYLNLSACKKLKKLTINGGPESDEVEFILKIAGLQSLESAIILNNYKLTTIDFSGCQNLLNLRINRCTNLKELNLKQCSNLQNLEVSSANNLKIHHLDNCNKLKNIALNSIAELSGAEYIGNHFPLEAVHLKMHDNISLNKLIADKRLLHLNLSNVSNKSTIDFTSAKEIKNVGLESIKNITQLSVIAPKNIRTFKLLDGGALENLFLSVSHDVEKISIAACRKLQNINLTHCKNIHELDINDCHSLKSIDPLILTKVSVLSVWKCRSLDVLNLQNSSSIKRILLKENDNLAHVDFSSFAELEELEIDSCDKLQDLNLRNCLKLKRIIIKNCRRLSDINAISVSAVEGIHITNCHSLKSVDLRQFPQLKTFEIHSHTSFGDKLYVDNMNIDACAHLEKLYLENISANNLELGNLKRLTSVSIRESEIKNVNLTGSSNLTALDIYVSSNKISDHVTHINLSRCEKLNNLELRVPHKIEFEHLDECEQLRKANIYLANQENVNQIRLCLPVECKVNFGLINKDVAPVFSTQNEFDEMLLLAQQNQTHPVLQFTKVTNRGVDANTKSDGTFTAAGNFFVEFFGQEHLPTYHYRVNILDKIEVQNNDIIFNSNIRNGLNKIPEKCLLLTKNDMTNVYHQAKSNAHAKGGLFRGELEPGEIYPLPSSSGMTKDRYKHIFVDPNDDVEIFWHSKHQQFYMQLKSGVQKTTHVEILYLCNDNVEYKKSPHASKLPVISKKEDLLPAELVQFFDKHLKTFQPLAFIFSDINISEKLKLLEDYCRDFKNEELTNTPQNNFDKLLAPILEQKGACRHRSKSFELLARYIGVPVDMIDNGFHEFCQIPFPDLQSSSQEWHWHRVDLGGAPSLDLTPLEHRRSIANEIPVQAKASSKLPQSMQLSRDQIIHQQFIAKYTAAFEKLVDTTEVTSLAAVFDYYSGFSPLIELSANQNAFDAHKHIMQQLKATGFDAQNNYFYINSVEDFKLLLKPYQLENGKRRKIEGPLVPFLEKNGVIVVNWSNFSHKDLLDYKTIIDRPPTLLGLPVSKQLKVIGLSLADTEACQAFGSRCKKFKIKADFFKDVPSPVTEKSVSPVEEINLYHRLNWRDNLLGKIYFDEDKIILQDGPLLEAILNNKPLHILNPPDDAEFSLLLSRISTDRKILYNGKIVPVPANVIITTSHKEPPTELKNVSIKAEAKDEKAITKQKFYLGLYNLEDCFEQTYFNTQKRAKTLPGLLSQYDDTKHEFYITDTIPKAEWQYLLAYISKYYPNKQFNFILAPGTKIEEIQENKNLIITQLSEQKSKSIENTDNPYYITNDLNFLTRQLTQKYSTDELPALVVDITPETTFADLISEKSIVYPETDASKVDFIYEEKGVLTALKQGKAVILNGALSPALYQQLMPLFSKPPHQYYDNTQYHEIKASLISVQPTIVKESLPQVNFHEVIYSKNDYSQTFPEQDSIYLQQIFNFYNYAEKLPHQGIGRPTTPEMSYDRLKNMVDALKTRQFHKQNPIKGLFHYDYPIGSEDYCYLNVAAKYQFIQKPQDISTAEQIMPIQKIAGESLIKLETSGHQLPGYTPPSHITTSYDLRLQNVREDKLREIIKIQKINNIQDVKNHIWKLLNCFGVDELKKILGEDLNLALDKSNSYPALTMEMIRKIWSIIEPYISTAKTINRQTKNSHVAKREYQLRTLLENDSKHIIVLKGPPGVGKTHAVRQVLKDYYEGEHGIIDYLEKGDKPLLLDEANLAKPGNWDFLAAIRRGDKIIYYRDKPYIRNAKPKKVIATINPEYYPKREYHKLFQHQAETIRFEMPEDDFLENVKLATLLKPHRLFLSQYTQGMLKAFQLIRELNPTFIYSTRDLENLALRFIALCDKERDPIKNIHTLWRACVGEFAGSIADASQRTEFVQRIGNELNIDPAVIKSKDFIKLTIDKSIHPERSELVESIDQDLLMRQQYLAVTENSQRQNILGYKPGVLIEGDPGVGKSFVLKAILEKYGFQPAKEFKQKGLAPEIKALLEIFILTSAKDLKQKEMKPEFKALLEEHGLISASDSKQKEVAPESIDTQKLYYVLSAGDEDIVAEILIKAFHEGSAVILDEINLNESLENLLNKLLDGVDLEGKPANKKGFIVFSSQNPSYLIGRKSLSPATRNRLHALYMDPYTKQALIEIAQHNSVKDPEAFVDAYLKCKNVTMRAFYNLLDRDKLGPIYAEMEEFIASLDFIEQTQQQHSSSEKISRVEKPTVDLNILPPRMELPIETKKPVAVLNEAALALIKKKINAVVNTLAADSYQLSKYHAALAQALQSLLNDVDLKSAANIINMTQGVNTLIMVFNELSRNNEQTFLSIDPASQQMTRLFKSIINKWPDGRIESFYITDKNQQQLIETVFMRAQTVDTNTAAGVLAASTDTHKVETEKFLQVLTEVENICTGVSQVEFVASDTNTSRNKGFGF